MSVSYRLYNAINRFANTLRKEYNIEYPHKNIIKTIELLGGKIIYSYIDRIIVKESENAFYFIINKKYIQNSNVCIMKAIYEFFISSKNTVECSYFSCHDNEEGYEFDLCFLMPQKIFENVLDKHTDTNNNVNITEVAKFFNVTEMQVINRGRRLSLLQF